MVSKQNTKGSIMVTDMKKITVRDLRYIFEGYFLIHSSKLPQNVVVQVDSNKTRGSRGAVYCRRLDNPRSIIVLTEFTLDIVDVYQINMREYPEYFI
jgi:hypothetical protein